MSRIKLQVPRGNKATMPALLPGELSQAADEGQLYMGTTIGNEPVMLNTTATPSGSGGGVSAPMHKTGDQGPVAPQKVVTYAKLVLNGTTYWVPLMQ